MEVCCRKVQVMEVCDGSGEMGLSADALQALLEFDRSQAASLLSQTSELLLPGEETDTKMPTADWVATNCSFSPPKL